MLQRRYEKLQNATPLSDVFFTELQRQTPLHSLDNKAHFAKEASQYLKTMPNGIFKKLMLEKLAFILEMPVTDLEESLQQQQPFSAASSQTKANNRKKVLSKLLTPSQLASALLLQQPELIAEVEGFESILKTLPPGDLMLTQIIKVMKSHPQLPIGQLITFWKSPDDKQLLIELANHKLHAPLSGRKAEFLGALQRLKEQQSNQAIKRLIEKAKTTGLNSEEKRELCVLFEGKTTRV